MKAFHFFSEKGYSIKNYPSTLDMRPVTDVELLRKIPELRGVNPLNQRENIIIHSFPHILMKGTEQFKVAIKNYLDKRALEDALFRAKYETTSRTIDDVVTYILNEVNASGCNGFADAEIYSMAVHVIDEPTLEIGKPIECNVVVNHHVEITDEAMSLQSELALKGFQDEKLRTFMIRNSKPRATKPQETKQPELSLFDDFEQ